LRCRIIVLEGGKVVEHDTPTALLDDQNSVFHGMAKDANLI
jgi:ABC-type multidrug transport system fused ATPase/permease subunit